MPLENELVSITKKHRYYAKRGAFFSSASGRPLGAGILLEKCRLPYLDPGTQRFRTARGLACVITHECDIDQNNERSFNDKLIVLPIIDFKIWYENAKRDFGDGKAYELAVDIVKDNIFRVLFLPAISHSTMEYGGILYLNEMTNTDVEDVNANANILAALTSYSFRILSYKIENHLLRPKSAPLMGIN